jgi:hypothetical protein
MHSNTILSQLQHLIPRHHFDKLVFDHSGDYYVKNFSCWNQLTVLLYAQSSGLNSLRDIQTSLSANTGKLYHLGLTSVKRSTLSDANLNRNYMIYESLFYKILEHTKALTPKHGFKFKNPLNILDATVIDLCLSAFPWAKFVKAKGAIKLHCQLEYGGNIPSFAVITGGRVHEITVARESFSITADSIYCFDKGYVSYKWFNYIDKQKAFFVTRARDNMDYTVIGQHNSDKKKNIISDEIISLANVQKKDDYSGNLRLIKFKDPDTKDTLVFLANNFSLSASTIAAIYKARWQIEVFFKWIKQNLKIKSFLGTSKNAVLTQVWIAMCYFLLLAYIKYQTNYKYSLFYLHKVIRATILERFSLIDVLNLTVKSAKINSGPDPQLSLNLGF